MDKEPAKSRTKTQGGDTRWKPGQSGNPRGNHCGSRHKSTLFLEALLKDEGKEIIQTIARLAKQGDPAAMRIAAERLIPPVKSVPIRFALPDICIRYLMP